MDPEKDGNSNILKQENDHQNDDSAGVGRSYECTFCKRGFTNAQALGGHMNIHRKDKAKAKQKNLEETSNKSNLRFMPQVSSDGHHQQICYQSQRPVGAQMNYPSPNPNLQTENYLPLWRTDRLDSRLDANLCLRIGATPTADGDGDGQGGLVHSNHVKENEVDLELRLGHDL